MDWSNRKWKAFLKSGNFRRKVSKYRSLIPEAKFQNEIRDAAPSRHGRIIKKQKSWQQPLTFRRSDNGTHERKESDRNYHEKPVETFEPSLEQLLEFEQRESMDCFLSVKNSLEEPRLDQMLEAISKNDMLQTTSAIGDENSKQDLGSFLRGWSIKHKITHQALRPLLEKLVEYHRQLPVDPRRLLKTPHKTAVVGSIDGGSYWHNSIENCLRKHYANITASHTISININIDGLPLFKNGTAQVWPILFNVFERPDIPPMIAGIFYGKCKPKKVEQYMTPFVEDILPMMENGLIINHHKLTINIRAIICDAPSRAFVKGVTNFNAIHGCLQCCTIGEYSKEIRTTIFPQTVAECRTDRGFRDRLYGKHVISRICY